MNIYSKRLGRNIDLRTEQCGEMELISHRSIVEILDEIDGTDISYDVISNDSRHSVILCRLKDRDGNCVTEIGEALFASLNNDISKMYPTTMAFTRAFDRAVVRYLMIPGKNYSNTEILADDHAAPEALQMIADTLSPRDDNISEALPVSTAPGTEPVLSDPGDTRITIGKYAGHPATVREIVSNPKEASWVSFIIDRFSNSGNLQYKAQANALRLYTGKGEHS